MSEHGLVAIDRGIWDHPIFAREPFTEREAWQWLIHQAVWKATRVRVGRAVVELERGQLAFATRFMAVKWMWSEARVRRFLHRLEGDAMVSVQTTRQATHITVCNYDKWQFGRRTCDAPSDAHNDTQSTHSRRKEEELNNFKKEDSYGRVAKATPPTNEQFDDFWKSYPKRRGENPKAPARKLFDAAVKGGADPQEIVAGVKAAAARHRDKIGTEFIPQAVKWLRDRRWEDYAAETAAPSEAVPINWDRAVELFKTAGIWPGGLGPSPGTASCRAPPEVLRNHGYLDPMTTAA